MSLRWKTDFTCYLTSVFYFSFLLAVSCDYKLILLSKLQQQLYNSVIKLTFTNNSVQLRTEKCVLIGYVTRMIKMHTIIFTPIMHLVVAQQIEGMHILLRTIHLLYHLFQSLGWVGQIQRLERSHANYSLACSTWSEEMPSVTTFLLTLPVQCDHELILNKADSLRNSLVF